MDLENLDVDFIEDMMLKSKPLQSVLNDIRNRQKVPAPMKTLERELTQSENTSDFFEGGLKVSFTV